MSESKSSGLMSFLHWVTFAVFVAAKVASTGYMAAWSWWWLLLPQVPCAAGLLRHFGAI